MSTEDNRCKSGCGFFGNDSFEGHCSKCFKTVQLQRESQKIISASLANIKPVVAPVSATPVKTSETTATVSITETLPVVEPTSTDTPTTSVPTAAEAVQDVPAPAVQSPTSEAPPSSASELPSSSTEGSVVEDTAASAEPAKRPQPPGRCFSCNKKVGINGFDCRCGYTFCGQHRMAEQHECDFNYKDFKRDNIAKINAAVIADKVDKL